MRKGLDKDKTKQGHIRDLNGQSKLKGGNNLWRDRHSECRREWSKSVHKRILWELQIKQMKVNTITTFTQLDWLKLFPISVVWLNTFENGSQISTIKTVNTEIYTHPTIDRKEITAFKFGIFYTNKKAEQLVANFNAWSTID